MFSTGQYTPNLTEESMNAQWFNRSIATNRRRRKISLSGVMLLTAIVVVCWNVELFGQSGRGIGADTGTVIAPPMLRMWNWPDTLFLIGTYGGSNLRDSTGEVSNIWSFFDSMAVDLFISADYYDSGNATDSINALKYFDSLAMSADISKGHRIGQWDSWPYSNQIGYARAVEFYPFDSVQSPYYPFRFMSMDDTVYGEIVYNSQGIPNDTLSRREQRYDSSNTPHNTVIAEHITFNEWDEAPRRIYRWSSQAQAHGEDSVQTVDRWIMDDRSITDGGKTETSRFDSLYYVVITGHLFENGTSLNTDSLLKVEVIYEVQKDDYFYAGTSPPRTVASVDTTFLVTTLYVTKNNLYPSGPPFNWNQYREVVLPLDLRFLANGAWGPTNPNTLDSSISRRFDLKVTWLGGEQLALRSVSLRSLHGQLTLGTDAAAKAWRQQRIDLIRRTLYGTSDYDVPDDSLRRAWIGVHPVEEQHPTAYVGLEYLTQMVRDTFNVPRPGGASGERDSVGEFTTQSYIADLFHHHHLSSPATTVIETYLWTMPATGTDSADNKRWFNLRYEEIPSIREENGGRFHLGEIDIDDPTSIEEYEKTLQRLLIGRYIPDWSVLGPEVPEPTTHPRYRKRWGLLHRLGDAARVSRATGRRLIQAPSFNGAMNLIPYDDGGTSKLDTVVGHFGTAAELRMLTNLGLAYGSKGLVYWWFPSTSDIAHKPSTDSTVWGTEGVYAGFGPIGSDYEGCYTYDTLRNTVDWTLHTGKHPPKSDPVTTIPDFYVGFGTRTRAVKNVNRRLKEIGKVMMNLTWRESYSVHYTTRWPWDSGMLDYKSRPLGSTEILKGVRAWDPRTGAIDSAWATFVEVGMFDKQDTNYNNYEERLRDGTYLMVVNRRTFERPDHVLATSARGRKMDSLAESRTVELTLDFPYQDTTYSTQYNVWFRVREILPSRIPLPLLGARTPVDTAFRGGPGKKVFVHLPPGESALLELSYAAPDESMVPGVLAHNNQRKGIFDEEDGKYMGVYHRYDSTIGDWHVYFRRSLPVSPTGTILWEPVEHDLSAKLSEDDPVTTQNSHPSLTFRRLSNSTEIVSVVWTAHGSGGTRQVLLREGWFEDYFDSTAGVPVSNFSWMPVKQVVGLHKGVNADEWGTPVIASSSASSGIGEYIAWSDSTVGIIARGLLYDTTVGIGLSWTPYDTITKPWNNAGFGVGKFPSMPPFTHRGMGQESSPIVWQQPGVTNTGISYTRLGYVPPSVGPKLQLIHLDPSTFWISPNADPYATNHYLNPSIDQSQDGLGRVMEGVTWEQKVGTNSEIYFHAVYYDSSVDESILITNAIGKIVNTQVTNPPPCYPVVSSQNQVMSVADSSAIPLFSISYESMYCCDKMSLLETKWLFTGPLWVNSGSPPWHQNPRTYWHTGKNPSGVSSTGSLVNRYTILYAAPPDSTLRTSREFFARSRPGGYEAEGLQVGARIPDSLPYSFSARLYDVWVSDAVESRGIAMEEMGRPDSLSDMIAMLRSKNFQTGDSLSLGGTIYLQFFAQDSAGVSDKWYDAITELVDSSSGAVVLQLDSTRVSVAHRDINLELDSTVDLLSGTYYLRLRLVASTFGPNISLDSNYWITPLSGWIESFTGKRLRKLDGEAGNGLRISAQPNPTTGETEFRFSVSRKEHVSMTVYDAMGREVERMIEKELFEAGRYAVEFDGSTLKPGTYLVELKTLNGRVTEKIIVQR